MIEDEELKIEIKRKILQLNVSLSEDVEFDGTDHFEDVVLLQNNLSSISPEEVDLSIDIFGKHLDCPLIISPMVGGFKDATKINLKIAESVSAFNIAMGVGNQIFGKLGPEHLKSYKVVRDAAPDALIFGNLWAKYFPKTSKYVDLIKVCIDMIDADVMEIPLSPLTELFYHTDASRGARITDYLEDICESIEVPIVVRSLESGFIHEDVQQLWDLGVDGIDSQGMGGTDLVKIESLKHMSLAEKQSTYERKVFDYWGIHTIWSLLDIKLRKENHDIPLIVGGGIRNGLQATKCLALGADMIGVGYPALIQVIEDIGYPKEENLNTFVERIIYEMKMVMASMGAKNVEELREICFPRLFVKGETERWLSQRKLNLSTRK